MSRKYKAPQCAFKLVDGHVETDRSVMRKMTGTALGGIFAVSPYSTPFQVACSLLGVCREDLDGRPAIEIGKYLEARIVDYCAGRYPEVGAFIPAEEVFAERSGDHDDWVSDWDDEYFAGHLDGVVLTVDGIHTLEVKTTGNIASWENGVPAHYKLQVQLYNHFMHQKPTAFVALGTYGDDVRQDMTNWIASDDTVMLFEMQTDDDQFEEKLEEAREWYRKFIMNGLTPEYNPDVPGDVDMWKHLVALASDESGIKKDVDRIEELTSEIETIKETLKPLEEELDDLRDKVKTFIDSSKCGAIHTTSTKFVATVTYQNRTSIDKAAAAKDGVDLAKYTVSKQIPVLQFKPVKVQTL